MGVRAETLSSILDVVYRAAVEPQAWSLAMQEVSNLLGSSISGLVVHDRRTGAFPLVGADPRSPMPALDDYARYYGTIDELRAFARQATAGAVLTESVMLSEEVRRASECYNDFYCRWGMQHFVGSFLANDAHHEASLVVYRGPREGAHTAEHVAAMRLLVPHLRRALSITLRLGDAVRATDSLASALDALAAGVLVVDRSGRVTWHNRAAGEILERRDGLAILDGEIAGAGAQVTTRLRRLVRSATSPDVTSDAAAHLAVERTGGEPPYLLFAVPLRSPLEVTADGSAMVFVTDGAADRTSLRGHLAVLYGLTPAEVELAVALVDGRSLEEIAAWRRISVETARGQLKAALQKTGTHRQAELVALLLGSPAALVRARR